MLPRATRVHTQTHTSHTQTLGPRLGELVGEAEPRLANGPTRRVNETQMPPERLGAVISVGYLEPALAGAGTRCSAPGASERRVGPGQDGFGSSKCF